LSDYNTLLWVIRQLPQNTDAFTIFKKNKLIVCGYDQNKNVTGKNVSEKTMDFIKLFIFQLFILTCQGKIFKIYQ
jgi:hypothetical protein